MQPHSAHSKDPNQNPKKWHSKALDAVVNFIVGPTDSESDFSQSESDTESDSSSSQCTVLKQDLEKLKHQNAELTKSLNALIQENESNYFKSREREKQLKQQYEAIIEKCKQENIQSVRLAKELKKEHEMLKVRYNDLQKKAENCQENLKTYEAMVSKLKTENQSLKAINNRSKEGDASQKLSDLGSKYQALLNEKNNLLAFFQQLSQSIIGLEGLESYKTKEYHKIQDNAMLQMAITTFEKGLKQIQLELEINSKNHAEKAIKSSESKLQQYKAETEAAIKKHLEEKNLLNHSISQIMAEKKTIQTAMDNLVAEVKKNQELLEKDRSSIKILFAENLELQRNVAELKQKIVELQTKIPKTEEDGFEIVD